MLSRFYRGKLYCFFGAFGVASLVLLGCFLGFVVVVVVVVTD